MTTEDYRPCGRGCVYRGKHREGCPEDGCPGCLPARTIPGTNLCARCTRRLRESLTDAADLCGHIRSMIDPRKSGWNFDREKTGGSPQIAHSPAPMNVDLIDAGNEVIQILTGWAVAFGDPTEYHLENGFPSTVTPERAFGLADWAAQYLTNELERIAADSDVVLFSRYVLDYPSEPQDWTIRKALDRFPLEREAFWSKKPCPFPGCGVRTIRVSPPRREGQETRYECRSCGWTPPAFEKGLWQVYFEGISPLASDLEQADEIDAQNAITR